MFIELNDFGANHLTDAARQLLNQLIPALGSGNVKLRTPAIFLLEHDLTIVCQTLLALIGLPLVLAVLVFIITGQPTMFLLTLLSLGLTGASAIGLGALWGVPINTPNTTLILVGLIYSASQVLALCLAYSNGQDGRLSASERMTYAFQSIFDGLVVSR